MNTDSLEDLYRAKESRRKQLAALSVEEKVEIIEQLQELGRVMRAARRDFGSFRDLQSSTHGPRHAR